MKYGVFSDIHGNYEAFKPVLYSLKKMGVDGYVFCGDLAGYGPQPAECVKEIRALENCRIVLGNHDAALLGKIDIKWFNEAAAKAIEFSKKMLDGDTLAWMGTLPEKIETDSFSMVHGSPRNFLKEYLLSDMQFIDNLKYVNNQVCFIGHSHMPMYFKFSGGNKVQSDFIKPMERIVCDSKCFINPGSVGQPRDGNPLASFGVYDDEKKSFELYRVEYDVAKTQKLMEEMGMPKVLVERLAMGY